jgi:hypothetical protein
MAFGGNRVAVFFIRGSGVGGGEGGRGGGSELIATFTCESTVTALAALSSFPLHPKSTHFTRFRHNHCAILTGHVNGFVNVWWCAMKDVDRDIIEGLQRRHRILTIGGMKG